MILSLNEEIAIALTLPLLMVAAHIISYTYSLIRNSLRERCIARIVRMMIRNEEPTDKEIHALQWIFSHSTIAYAAGFISEHLYGNAIHRLRLITEVCEVDFSFAENSELNDISAFIEAYPDQAILYIARLNSPLTWHEVARLTQLLRRTGVSIAYTPLLISKNRNLQLIGIYLCQLFTIFDAEPHLQRLAISEDEEVAYMALLTLCSVRGDISSPQTGSSLARMMTHQRTAFVRHAVQACYSLQSSAPHLSAEERRLFRQQLNSYKSQIVCN